MQESEKDLDQFKRVEEAMNRWHLCWVVAAFFIVAMFGLPHLIREMWPTAPASAQTDPP